MKKLTVLVLSLSYLFAIEVMSQELSPEPAESIDVDYLMERMAARTVHIDGAKEPSQIPLTTRLGALFRHYNLVYAAVVRENADDNDRRAIESFIDDELVIKEGQDAEFAELVESLCESLAVIGSVSFANTVYDWQQASSARQQQRYSELLGSLSDSGRDTVIALIDETIPREVRVIDIDFVGLYAEFPDYYASRLRNQCASAVGEKSWSMYSNPN